MTSIRTTSIRSRSFAALASVLAAGTLACGPAEDVAPPVATPALTLQQSELAVGAPIDVSYRFVVADDAPAFAEDYLVFVHFKDADGERMWTDDHRPATPTTQWKPGATIEYTRTMFVPRFPYTGAATVEMGLYSAQSGDRLPLAGENVGQRAYRAAAFTMRLENESTFVVFRDGWHPTETGDQGSGLEWQWSRQNGTLSFRNPGADAVLFLEMDQPVEGLGTPQRVEVRVGQEVVDTFPLPPGTREVRRIPLTAGQMGSGESVGVAISVDRTFVPASVPGLRSADARELGVRVFRAFVQSS